MSVVFHYLLLALAGTSAALCLAAGSLRADYRPPDEYTVREWTEASGLPSNDVFGLAQDARGYLWVFTYAGIARFDGFFFETKPMTPGVAPGGIRTLRDPMAAAAPVLAAAPIGGSSFREDGWYLQDEGGGFKFQPEPLLAGKIVSALFTAPDGALWLGCRDGTLLRRHGSDVSVFTDLVPASGSKRIPNFATDQQQRVWVVIGAQVFCFDEGKWKLQFSASRDADQRLCSSSTGGPWLLTSGAIYKWNAAHFEEILPLPTLVGAHFLQCALEDAHGALWLGTRSQGLFRYAAKKLLHVPTTNDDITALWADAEGDLWVATEGGGLNRLRPKAHQLYDKSRGLKDNFSYTVAEDSGGVIWLGNRDGGVARVVNGTVDPITVRANWRLFAGLSVYPAHEGGVWISTGIGMFRTDPQNPDNSPRHPTIPNYRTYCTFVASNGDYWFAFGAGRIGRWRAGELLLFGPTEGFDAGRIHAIAEDKEGVIWIGGVEGRIFRKQNEKFERVFYAGSDRAGDINSFHFEPDGTIWVGTSRLGVLVFPPANRSQPRILDTDAGMPSNNIANILVDDYDRIWFASRSGIFWVHRAQLRAALEGGASRIHAVMLGVDDGLPELSSLGRHQPSAWKARDGKLWFATHRGVLCTDPALTTGTDSLPLLTVSALHCDGRPQALSRRIKIASTARKIEVRLSALCLSTPSRVQVRYRLEGFDDDWVILNDNRLAAYPRLPAGAYVFRAMASKGNGLADEQPELFTLIVTAPWWQSIWARLLYLLLVVVGVAAVVRARSLRQLRRRLHLVEHERTLERERTRIARNIHDELGASLTHISLLTQTAQHQHPAQAGSFEQIYEATHEITRKMDEIVWAVNPTCDDLENFVFYVGNFAQRFLAAANIRCRLDVPANPSHLRLSGPVRHNLFLCCKEALNNAVKYSHAELVTIAISLDGPVLRISIADDGRGIDSAAEERRRLNAPSGLENLRQRMAEIGGECEFSPRPGGGLIVSFTLAVPAATAA